MLHVIKSRWRNRWHVWEIDTGGSIWLATFRNAADACAWVRRHYEDDQ